MPETKLQILLSTLSPVLHSAELVFCCVQDIPEHSILSREVFSIIRETEGWTIILEKETADRMGWCYDGIFRRISLEVHSSVEAVGLTAVVATELTKHTISANVVAGFHHDHILVPSERADEALRCLQFLQSRCE